MISADERKDAAEKLFVALRIRAQVMGASVDATDGETSQEVLATLQSVVPPLVASTLRARGASDEDIADVTQQVLLACWLGRSNAMGPGQAIGFIRTCARNAYVDMYRRTSRETVTDDASDRAADGDPSLVALRDLQRLERRVLAALCESGQAVRIPRVKAFLDHRLDPDPPADDPGPALGASERRRTRDARQQARSVGRKYLLELVERESKWFDEGELELLDKLAGAGWCDVSEKAGQQRPNDEEPR